MGGRGLWGNQTLLFVLWLESRNRQGGGARRDEALVSGIASRCAFFGPVAYFTKQEFALVPFLFLSILVVGGAISSRAKLKRMESHPSEAYAIPLSTLTEAKEQCLSDRNHDFHNLRALARPRPVRFKPVPCVISVAYPISLIFLLYVGLQIKEHGLGSNSFADLAPLVIAVVIWSGIAVYTIRRARRDRRLLSEGELAVATVMHQELSGGKHRVSRINYEFRDAAGKRVQGKATDDSRSLYEEMQAPVFYDPAKPEESVPLVAASCELKPF